MIFSVRARRLVITGLVAISSVLAFILLLIPSPDMSVENDLRHRIAHLSARMRHAERVNVDRQDDLQRLFAQFSELTRQLQSQEATSKNYRKSMNGRPLSYEADALVKGANWTYDLSLPSIRYALPHTVRQPKSLSPTFKWSKGRSQVSMVLGIPTVKRDHQSYLQSTLRSVFDNMEPEEMDDTLVVVFIAEVDAEFVASIAAGIKAHFAKQLSDGVLDVIAPHAEFYPKWSTLRQTLGDSLERVEWRSKQNLDYAFLMMYAQWRGTYYVQLEDDILTKPKFVTTMKNFALEKTAVHEPWFVIDFCQLGFIGKMFASTSLPILVQFFLTFYNDKPVDWLLDNVIQTKVCKLDQDFKKCQKERAALWIRYKPSLFQHIGTHSSLKGKVQKLKDKQFGRVSLFTPHRNPPVTIETNIKHYKQYSLARAYKGETFYWALVPQAGDYILFKMNPPVMLNGYKFVSGNAEHPSDRFDDTQVDVLLDNQSVNVESSGLTQLSDGYACLGSFDANGIAEGSINAQTLGKVTVIRLSIKKTHNNWAILSEIQLRTPDLDNATL